MRTTNTQNSNEVLFQKLGNTWYVFSEVNNDLIYSALPEDMDPRTTRMELFEIIEEHMQKVSKHYSSPRRKAEVAA